MGLKEKNNYGKNNYEILLDIKNSLDDLSVSSLKVLRQVFTIEELIVLRRLVDRALMKEVE